MKLIDHEFKPGYVLSEFRETDIPELSVLLNDYDIYRTTLRIPYPYTSDHAKEWIQIMSASKEKNGFPSQFAMRSHATKKVVGGIGLIDFQPGSHQSEIGYWVAKSNWGQGLATSAVQSLVQNAKSDFRLLRLTAKIFATNVASEKVLLNSGFEYEGLLKLNYLKEGKFQSAKIFAWLDESIKHFVENPPTE